MIKLGEIFQMMVKAWVMTTTPFAVVLGGAAEDQAADCEKAFEEFHMSYPKLPVLLGVEIGSFPHSCFVVA